MNENALSLYRFTIFARNSFGLSLATSNSLANRVFFSSLACVCVSADGKSSSNEAEILCNDPHNEQLGVIHRALSERKKCGGLLPFNAVRHDLEWERGGRGGK